MPRYKDISPRQGIVTRFVPATNTRGSRYSATCAAGRLITGADDRFDYEQNHRVAAQMMVDRMKWGGPHTVLIGAGLPTGGYVWTTVDTREIEEVSP